jgi:hypothetical protein
VGFNLSEAAVLQRDQQNPVQGNITASRYDEVAADQNSGAVVGIRRCQYVVTPGRNPFGL